MAGLSWAIHDANGSRSLDNADGQLFPSKGSDGAYSASGLLAHDAIEAAKRPGATESDVWKAGACVPGMYGSLLL